MSPLSQRLAEYLRIRRQLGFKLKLAGHTLEDFVGSLNWRAPSGSPSSWRFCGHASQSARARAI